MTRKIFSEALEKLSKNEIITNIDGLKNIDYTGFPVYVNVSHTSTPFYIEIVKALPNNSTDPNAIKYKFDVFQMFDIENMPRINNYSELTNYYIERLFRDLITEKIEETSGISVFSKYITGKSESQIRKDLIDTFKKIITDSNYRTYIPNIYLRTMVLKKLEALLQRNDVPKFNKFIKSIKESHPNTAIKYGTMGNIQELLNGLLEDIKVGIFDGEIKKSVSALIPGLTKEMIIEDSAIMMEEIPNIINNNAKNIYNQICSNQVAPDKDTFKKDLKNVILDELLRNNLSNKSIDDLKLTVLSIENLFSNTTFDKFIESLFNEINNSCTHDDQAINMVKIFTYFSNILRLDSSGMTFESLEQELIDFGSFHTPVISGLDANFNSFDKVQQIFKDCLDEFDNNTNSAIDNIRNKATDANNFLELLKKDIEKRVLNNYTSEKEQLSSILIIESLFDNTGFQNLLTTMFNNGTYLLKEKNIIVRIGYYFKLNDNSTQEAIGKLEDIYLSL